MEEVGDERKKDEREDDRDLCIEGMKEGSKEIEKIDERKGVEEVKA